MKKQKVLQHAIGRTHEGRTKHSVEVAFSAQMKITYRYPGVTSLQGKRCYVPRNAQSAVIA